MRIRLLDNEKGIILSRTPFLASADLPILFDGAPKGATASFHVGETSFYRELKDGACLLPFKALNGVLSVAVSYFERGRRKRWECEGIRADVQEDGRVLVTPDDMDLPYRVKDLYLENQALRESLAELEKRFSKLSDRFDGILEGYDIT